MLRFDLLIVEEFPVPSPQFVWSIRQTGLRNPPVVRRLPRGVFQVVSGHRRVLAIRHLVEQDRDCFDPMRDRSYRSRLLYYTVPVDIEED